MTIKFVPFAVILVSMNLISYAQKQVGRNIEDHLLIRSANKDLYGDTEKDEVEGSPYLNDAFIKGTVYSFNGVFDYPMRYNIFEDYIEFQRNNQTFILDPEPRVKKVNLDNEVFVVLKFEYKGKYRHGFLEVLDSGKVSLLAKKTILFREWQEAKALGNGPTPAKFTRTDDVYYYKIGEGEVVKIDNLKKMIEGFPDKKNELSQFAKSEKINTKDEEDLKKLIKYYNSL